LKAQEASFPPGQGPLFSDRHRFSRSLRRFDDESADTGRGCGSAGQERSDSMRVVPRNKGPRLQFFLTHLPKWIENAEALGLSAEILVELQAKVDETCTKRNAQYANEQAARSATQEADSADEAMSNLGAAVIQQIRARARTAGPSIYSLGSISPPKDASPIAPPGKPDKLKAQLMGGWLELRWTCKNPRGSTGTLYHLHRSVDGGPKAFIGLSGEKKFVDQTVPKGASFLEYEIRAIRSTQVGLSALFPVTLSGKGKIPGMMLPGPRKRKTYLAA
jgi:hypothetical protein